MSSTGAATQRGRLADGLRRPPRWHSPVVFGVAVAVYGVFCWRPVFWVDEYLTQVAIARSWPDLLRWISTTDPGPGPYYLVAKVWSVVSTSPGWMRIPSVLAGAGAVVVLAGLVRRLSDVTTASLAAGVMLVLPNVSRYAQENRPYAFALLCTVSTVALWQWSLPRQRSRWWCAGYGLAVAAMGLAHLYTLTLLPALAVAAVVGGGADWPRRLARTTVPATLAVLVISPHIGLNLAHPTGSPTEPALSGASLAGLLRVTMPAALVGLVAAFALAGIVVGLTRDRLRPAVVLGLLWLVVPAALLLAAKVAVDLPVTRVRYLLFLMPGLAMLVALGLRRLTGTSAVTALAVLAVMAVSCMPRHVDIRQVDGHNRDQALAPLLQSAARHGMPIVVANRSATRLVNAATYPDTVLSDDVDQARTPYVVVVERTRFAVPAKLPYYRADGTWRQIVKCRVAQALVLVFENTDLPQATAVPPDDLATRLSAATDGRVTCSVVGTLDRR